MANFFITSTSLDPFEVEEVLYSRYHFIEPIMNKQIEEFILFVNQMYTVIRKEKHYQQWLVQIPWMNKENYVSFEQYTEKMSGKNIDHRTTEELEAEIDEVERNIRERRK